MTTTTAPPTALPTAANPAGQVRRVAAAAAVLGVFGRVVSIFLWPPDSDASHARMLATAAAHSAAWNAATAVEALAWLAAGFALLTGLHLVTGRGRVLTRLGGWVYGSSLLALGFVGGTMNSVTATLASEPNRPLMVVVQGDFHAPLLDAFVTLILLGELALVVFAVGLARACLTGWWYIALAVLAVAGYVVTSSSSNHLVVLAGFAPLGASWLVLARLLQAPVAACPPGEATTSAEPTPGTFSG
jgi:hypothetical protein